MKTEKFNHYSSIEAHLRGLLGWMETGEAEIGYDIASQDGREVIELKVGHLGVRDLHAAVVRLALSTSRDQRINRAILVADFPRMSAKRVKKEWQLLRDLLRPDATERIALVARAAGSWVVLPDGIPELDRVLNAARTVFPDTSQRTPNALPRGGWTPPRQEVFKVLLDVWLSCGPALQVKVVAKAAECSIPTVNDTIAMLDELGEVTRTSSRSVVLAAFPRRSLNEVVLASKHTQNRMCYVDQSGHPADTAQMLQRLEKLAPPNVALGGVVAARCYVSDFDLNGLPRLDVKVLSGDSLRWVRQLDPALKRAKEGGGSASGPVLIVHQVPPRGIKSTGHSTRRLPLANLAETLLDLYDLGLQEQAEDFVRVLRTKGPTDV